MSEVCQLCKGAFSDDAVACPGGGWACKACVVKALAILKRVEAGELKLFDPGAFLSAVSDGDGVKDAMAIALDAGAKHGGLVK